MASWLINIGGFAKKVKNTTLSTVDEIKDFGAYLECPKCHHHIDNIGVSPEWPGFPAGVKFDPSDVEILEHLAAKCGIDNKEPHIFIHDFIPTLEEDQGICYTHPENLPGAKKDGSSVHFFHKTVNAYATGQRKRRKIHQGDDVTKEHVRWHKTGKTKAVIDNAEHKGFKKIMVLYVRSEKGCNCKPYKSNWVMHQYHLGSEEDEKDSEYVVSKIFYQKQKQQTRKIEKNSYPVFEDSDMASLRTSPETPKPDPPTRPLTGKCDDNLEDDELPSFIQDAKSVHGDSHAQLSDDVKDEENMSNSACLAGESQGVSDFDGLELDDILLCKEMLDSSAFLNDSELDSTTFNSHACCNDNASPYGISNLDTLELDTLPDFDLTNLQFCSPDNSFLQCMDMIQDDGCYFTLH